MKHLFVLLFSLSVSFGLYAQDEPTPSADKQQTDTQQGDTQQDDKKERPTKPEDLSKQKLFSGMIIAGLNATQIDGDRQGGFNKAGANVGVGLFINLPKRFSVGLELLYSMKGARASTDDFKLNFYRRSIDLDYIDIPVTINYTLKMKKTPAWGVMLSAGLIPGVLVRQNDVVLDQTLYGVQGYPYHKFNLESRLSVTGIFKTHYALGFSWEYSLIPIANPQTTTGLILAYIPDGQMRHQIISIRAIYIF